MLCLGHQNKNFAHFNCWDKLQILRDLDIDKKDPNDNDLVW